MDIWPASPQDLIPNGAETTVNALMELIRLQKDSRMLTLIPVFMRLCGPLVMPAVASTPAVPEYIVERGTYICHMVTTSPPLTPDGQIDKDVAHHFCFDIKHIADFCRALSRFFSISQMEQYHRGRGSDIFRFVNRALGIIHSPVISAERKDAMVLHGTVLGRYVAALYSVVAFKVKVTEPIHPVLRSHIQELDPKSLTTVFDSTGFVVFQVLLKARASQSCWALGCTESLQTTGLYFKRCGGCSVVGYCSRECQKRAWTDAHAPHKDICKSLTQIMGASGRHVKDGSRALFLKTLKEAHIVDATLNQIIRGLGHIMADGNPDPFTVWRGAKRGSK
ncbi:hypothetical protein B0H10DRAFT_2208826 [Mycena sp. CBHHK59/15]|nr:hypothetical protein B0H10DRAFT_2208826 [Mycena sp. CBHHK59/15]